ncbi:coiled-coil domain-containing protein 9-like [Mangifera indica]|uniref:coiled-coil domain-containing protein 9-like n=1 Tax=Mangifera indica TaxID=29780 RepID=UPI001CFA99D2|nr:coiled-coil domain-containing protein 9-like [Mangifera indica]XP_044471077.1 coiled-coil domain-containing protein 9-like [Mangifera indica]XP_044471078.1 coiled-coil domain-containing protein 9-like [Mangifera indica]
MASFCCLSTASTSKTLAIAPPFRPFSSASMSQSCSCSLVSMPMFGSNGLNLNSRRAWRQVVRMAPEEEKLTRRNPLDFPIEWERPKPGRRPDIFPQFSPMKTPLPPPLPCDPPEEDEEEEEKKEEEEEEEEDPEKEETEKPDNQ